MIGVRAVAALGLWLAVAVASNRGAGSFVLSPESQPRLVNFDFELVGMPIPHWSIEIDEDGTGRYGDISGNQDASNRGASFSTGRPIRVGEATHRRLEAGFDKVSAGACQTKIKRLANTGTKKIAYRSAAGTWVSCTFNYSDDKGLMDAAEAFQAIASTLQEGERLEHSHRYDRLGLDAEIDELAKQVSQGEAIELENIAPVLQEIVGDERVLERVRRKSARLLQDAGVPSGLERSPGTARTGSDGSAEPNER